MSLANFDNWLQTMSKDISAPLARTARLLDLVPYLNTHQGIALKELAKHFDVTTAQMSADLTTLWMCGLPGYTPLELMDLEFDSGFVTIRNAETLAKPRSITFQEGVALLLGLDLISASIPSNREDLKATAQSLRERISEKLGVAVHLQATPVISTEITTEINQAIEASTGLEIDYHSLYKDSISTRRIIAYEIYELEGNQYLRAFCFNANDFREFRLERIMRAVPASIPEMTQTQRTNSETINYLIIAKLASRDVAERFAVKDVVAGAQFPLSSYSTQWIQRSVLASGAAVVLNSPQDVRDQLLETAQEMLNRYIQA